MTPPPPPEYCFLWIDWGPLCLTVGEWASWAQAIGSLLAVGAAIGLVGWQLQHERRREEAEMVRRLQTLWTLTYHARVQMDYVCSQPLDDPAYPFSEPRGLGHNVNALRCVPPLDIPRADAAIAVLAVVEAYEAFHEGIAVVGREGVRPHANAAQDSFHFAEVRLRFVLQLVGAEIPPARYSINGQLYEPLGLDEGAND